MALVQISENDIASTAETVLTSKELPGITCLCRRCWKTPLEVLQDSRIEQSRSKGTLISLN